MNFHWHFYFHFYLFVFVVFAYICLVCNRLLFTLLRRKQRGKKSQNSVQCEWQDNIYWFEIGCLLYFIFYVLYFLDINTFIKQDITTLNIVDNKISVEVCFYISLYIYLSSSIPTSHYHAKIWVFDTIIVIVLSFLNFFKKTHMF